MTTGRNEPCPCGSGKKYKRCCGVSAPPKLTVPEPKENPIDPSQFDPQMMAQFAQGFQRLPKGQMQRLQALMQKAMNGKDVTREAEELERSLPLEFQEMLSSMKLPGMEGGEQLPAASAPKEDMSVDEARASVERAVAEGKLSKEEAQPLLNRQPS